MNQGATESVTIPGPGSGVVTGFLRLFTDIRPPEVVTVLLLALNIFLLLTAYYILKTVREGLILAYRGAVIKSYLAAAQAVLLIFVVRVFSRLASRFARQRLIAWVTLFFVSNLGAFYLMILSGLSAEILSILFFVWVGIFNVMVIAQFWAFGNDLFTESEGKRLFPLIMFGQTLGALSGSAVAGLFLGPLGLYPLLLVAGALLLVCIGLTLVVHRREVRRRAQSHARERVSRVAEQPVKPGDGFRIVFRSRYLLMIAGLILLLNLVNTTGEFILGEVFTRTADAAIQAGTAHGFDKAELIGKYYSDFFSMVNLLTMFLQLFVVSRIFRWFGVHRALFFLPFIALGGYTAIALGATFVVVYWAKILENSTDYSIMNTTRHALFLVTDRTAKYKAKAAIDTFFWRAGDVVSALVVFIGTTLFAFTVERFAFFNLVIVLVWIALSLWLAREYRHRRALVPVLATGQGEKG